MNSGALFHWLTFSAAIVMLQPGGVHSGGVEKKLLQHLFDSERSDAHNPLERPVQNETQAVVVKVKFTMQQLIDVDEKNQVIITNIWLDLKWEDYHFRWSPNDYKDIYSLNINPDLIWRPDLLLHNSADEKFDGTYPVNVVVYNTGEIQYVPPAMFKSTCVIEIAWFPFDTQTCDLKFGSWTYNGQYIDLQIQCEGAPNEPADCWRNGQADLSEYAPNGEWALITADVKRTSLEWRGEPLIDLTLKLHIRRRIQYYMFNLIIPCMLVSSMALLVFCLPPDAGEKISLGVTILLSLTMFLMLVANYIPQTSGAVPLLGMYFICIMIICSLSVVFTVAVLHYHHKKADLHPVPTWIRIYVNRWLAKMVFMHPPPEKKDETVVIGGIYENVPPNFTNSLAIDGGTGVQIKSPLSRKNGKKAQGANTNAAHMKYGNVMTGIRLAESGLSDRPSRSLLANVIDLDEDYRGMTYSATTPHRSTYSLLGGTEEWSGMQSPHANQHADGGLKNPSEGRKSTHTSGRTSPLVPTTPRLGVAMQNVCSTSIELDTILQELRYITRKMREDEEVALETREWKFAAQVMDRFFLITFTLVTFIATLAILLSGPGILDYHEEQQR